MKNRIYDSILETIGETPLIELSRIVEKEGVEGRIFGKMELISPGLSKKDRVALGIIEAAEKSGKLKKGQKVVELTSGNFGTGLAIVCKQKGYDFIAVMSKGNSIERAIMIKAFGAEIVLVDQCPESIPGQVSGADLARVEEKAQELTKEYGAFRVDQFLNDDNVGASYERTAPEIIEQMGDTKIDVFADFMGSGGTFTGIAKALKEHNPEIECIIVEPENAAFYTKGEPGKGGHVIQGGGYNQALKFVENNKYIVDGVVTISDEDAVATERDLAEYEGIFAGPSSGANVKAALNLLKDKYKGKNIVVLIPDSGTKYLSTDIWDIM